MNITTKNRALLAGFLCVMIVGYLLAISDTIALRSNYKQLANEAQLFINVPERLVILSRKESHYDSLMAHYKITEASLQNSLLKSVEGFSVLNELKVNSFSQPHVLLKDQRQIHSYAFTLKGRFKDILGLAYHLEQRSKFGKISNLHFEKKKSYKTQKESLEGHFVLQLIQ